MMIQVRSDLSISPLLFAILAVGLCASTSTFGGGGRGGDSSMNPYTGDSYAYFHGGHNLGEEGMNIPWRKPVAQSTISIKRGAPSTTNESAAVNGSTREFRSVEPSGHQRANTQSDNN